MEQFLLNLLKTSLLGALAILLMLVSKPLWRERYRAKARCWLWLALAAFLLFPVDFSVKDAPVQAAPPQDYTLFVGTDKTTIQSTDHLFGDMAERSGQTSTQVRDSIIARPTLLLPHEGYDLNDLRYILRHELCHLKRRDMLLKLVLLAANALHWFNPVVYLMLRQADEDIELACDSAATDGLDRAERAAYSRTLLAAVQSHVRALPATTCFGGTVERLKRRITNVLGAQKKRGLGVVALVLALTLTAGCAVSWGERGRKNDDPFDGSRYNPVFVTGNSELTIGKNFRPLYYVSDESGTYFRLSREGGVNTVTMIYDGEEMSFSPMESVTLTQENFDGTLLPDLDALRSDNKTAWRAQLPDNFDDHDPDAAPNLAFLLKQEDGTLYLCIGYHFDSGDAFPEDTDRIRWVYRLEKGDDTLYPSMDDYAAACVEDLKQGTMSYCTSEDGNYASQVAEDTVADVRVTRLELGDSLEGLSPEGTALELWYLGYEMKPTNEAGHPIEPIGGQVVTDDGYLNENWTHYLTVLHHTSGEQTGYQIIGTTMSNDGLFYNGCGYSGEEKAYLHDFYVDYAGLDLPKMFIPNLLNDTATDGYGRANQCEAQLVAGDGYYYYVPITAWARSSDAEFWYSRYDTGSYFSVKKLSQSLAAAKAEWESTGAKAEKADTGWRFVTNEGMSSTVITLFDAPDNTCYQVETHWSFDGSTAENEWGWNRDRAVEGEAEVLRAMVKRFTVTAAIQPTQNDADSALDAALKQLGDTSGEVTLSLSVNGTDSSIYDGSTVINRAYFARQLSESLIWREANDSAAPSAQNCILLITADGGVLTFCESQPMHLWLTTPDGTLSCFKADVNEDIGSAWSLVRLWYDEAEYDALLRDVKPQPKSLSWQEAAQHWADAYYGAHTKAASGSSFKYTWVKALITPAEDTTKAKREMGEIDENTYCFTVEVQFTPESETALHYTMAGNTAECTDPSAPKGAYAFWRCCTIQLGSDGLWHGVMLGTGW